jgi:hypothetical protein
MRKTLIKLAASGAAIAMAAPASAATTIDFETTTTGAATTPGTSIGSIYSSLGITFSNAVFYQCGGGCPAPDTGTFISGAGFGTFTATFSNLTNAFSFANVSASSGTARAFGAAGNLLQSISFSAFPATFHFNVSGIKSVSFAPAGGYGVDNFAFDNPTPAVPEPATWAMMILGMGAVGFAMRRRQKGNVTTTAAYV